MIIKTLFISNFSPEHFVKDLSKTVEKLQNEDNLEVEVQYQITPNTGSGSPIEMNRIIYTAVMLGRSKN